MAKLSKQVRKAIEIAKTNVLPLAELDRQNLTEGYRFFHVWDTAKFQILDNHELKVGDEFLEQDQNGYWRGKVLSITKEGAEVLVCSDSDTCKILPNFSSMAVVFHRD